MADAERTDPRAERLIFSRGEVGATIEDRMAAHHVPGLSVAVIDDGEVVHASGHGVRRTGASHEVTPQTLFQACSISKPIAAMAMLRLVERGTLDLDADVNDQLTSWRLPANGGWEPRVTLRQIASHSAGLTTSGFPGYRRDEPLPSLHDILTGTAPANTFGVRVDTVPGTQFRYAGGGTTVMHQLLEDVTGTPLPDLLRELVLEPLGMRDSSYVQPLPEPLHERAASAHLRDGSVVPGGWHVYPEMAAAGLWTTPADLARYAIGVQRCVAGQEGALLSAELAEDMVTPQIDSGRPFFEHLGLGPFLGGSGPTRRFGHGGGNEGFKCQLVAYVERDLGIAVMTNSDNGNALCGEVADAVATAFEWPDWPAMAGDPEAPDVAALDRCVGGYELRPGVVFDVARQGLDLAVTFPGQPALTFYEYEGTTYYANVVETLLTFEDDAAGRRTGEAHESVTFKQNDAEVVCPRIR